jgi:hypothetical protein
MKGVSEKIKKGEFNSHLFSTLDLIDSPPLDLGVTQKSLRQNKRTEKEENTHSFFYEIIEEKS